MATKIDEEFKTTAALLKKARADPDAVSCFANGANWADTQEAVFVVKGKRKVEQAFAALLAADLITSNPVTPGRQNRPGVEHEGCKYMAPRGSICAKCGRRV